MDKFLNIKEMLNKMSKTQKILIIVIIVSALFLVFTKEDKKEITEETEKTEITDTETYVKELEFSLSEVIKAITGEKNVKIMITAETSSEKVYAKETEQNGDKTGEEYVIVKNSSQSQSVVILKEIEPGIKGVVVVTEKAQNYIIKEQIIEAVKTVLGISASKVSVVQMYSNQ